MKTFRASSLRLILPLLSRAATVDFFAIAEDDEMFDFIFFTFLVVLGFSEPELPDLEDLLFDFDEEEENGTLRVR